MLRFWNMSRARKGNRKNDQLPSLQVHGMFGDLSILAGWECYCLSGLPAYYINMLLVSRIIKAQFVVREPGALGDPSQHNSATARSADSGSSTELRKKTKYTSDGGGDINILPAASRKRVCQINDWDLISHCEQPNPLGAG